MKQPTRYFCIGAEAGGKTSITLHRQEGVATKDGMSLLYDGLIYELPGGRKILASDSPPKIAALMLDSYRRNRKRFFQRLNGQFTVAVVEGNQAACFRSRLSPSLIYYSDRYFSNHLLPVAQRIQEPKADLVYFADFLADHPKIFYDLPRTPFEAIRRLLPGETLLLKNGKIKRVPARTEATSPPYLVKPGQKASEVGRHIRELIELAVDTRLGDGTRPVVCELSGGLDSSLITSLVARRAKDVSAFMYAYSFRPSHDISEKFAREVAQEAGVPLVVLDPSQSHKTDLSVGQPYFDEPNPFFWQGAMFADAMAELVPDNALLFSGFGADQIFMRDPKVIPWLLKTGRYREFLKTVSDTARSLERSRGNLIWQSALAALPKGVYQRIKKPFEGWRLNPFAMEEMNADFTFTETVSWLAMPPVGTGVMGTDTSSIEYSYLVAPSTSTDPYTDPRGISSVHPFCDSRLIEYLTKEVSWHLVHDWENPYKNLLREVQRGLIPESVRTREKNEFSFEGFLVKLLRDNEAFLRGFLGDLAIPHREVIDRPKMHKALDELFFGLATNSSRKIVRLISYALWWRDFSGSIVTV